MHSNTCLRLVVCGKNSQPQPTPLGKKRVTTVDVHRDSSTLTPRVLTAIQYYACIYVCMYVQQVHTLITPTCAEYFTYVAGQVTLLSVSSCQAKKLHSFSTSSTWQPLLQLGDTTTIEDSTHYGGHTVSTAMDICSIHCCGYIPHPLLWIYAACTAVDIQCIHCRGNSHPLLWTYAVP